MVRVWDKGMLWQFLHDNFCALWLCLAYRECAFLLQELHVLLPCRGRLTAISRWNVNLQCSSPACTSTHTCCILLEESYIVQINPFVTEPQIDPELDYEHREDTIRQDDWRSTWEDEVVRHAKRVIAMSWARALQFELGAQGRYDQYLAEFSHRSIRLQKESDPVPRASCT